MGTVAMLFFVVFVALDQFRPVLPSDVIETTTLDEYFPKDDREDFYSRVAPHLNLFDENLFENTPMWHLRNEVHNYSKSLQMKVESELLSELSKVSLLTVSQDLKRHCGEDLKNTIEDFHVTPRNLTCVSSRLFEILMSKLKAAVAATVEKFSNECGRQQQQQPACNCAVDFDRRSANLLVDFVQDKAEVRSFNEYFTTPLEIVEQILNSSLEDMLIFETVIPTYFVLIGELVASVPSLEPFTYENFIYPGFIHSLLAGKNLFYSITQTQEDLTWGIVKSYLGNVDHPCDHFKEIQPNGSPEYRSLVESCFLISILRLDLQLARCVIEDRKYSSSSSTAPLTWSAVSSSYFHSQCLCVAHNRIDCGVLEEPRGFHCLSVLLKDFRRQISYRPAVTYRDYAFMTKVSLCQFARLVTVGFNGDCDDNWIFSGSFLIQSAQSAQCYFDGLVDRKLNCSQRPEIRDLNATFLCGLRLFVLLVACDDGDFNSSVPFYEAGDSALVEVLYYVDVSVRVLTLVTYLSCPQLRNLPGKLLIGYQTTALLRLLLVPRLEDLALAVRLDVTSDLSSTLWLTSYLHFLTSSIKTLRLPDSLSPDEVRAVLLRYSLLGWAAPAALSSLCFWMDDAVDSRVQFGQLLLVLCSYAALVWNIFMLYQNLNFYHDVKSNAASIKKNVKVRSVFADLFEFAVKTSVLSGAGITFRLIFTQIQGLEHVLSYYHAMGTLQGLLLFVLYGCNREARAFWRRTLSAKALRSCRRRENNPT